jgi:hypothetical protein
MRKYALALLRKDKVSKQGLRRRRLHADRDESYRESLIDQAFNNEEGLNL